MSQAVSQQRTAVRRRHAREVQAQRLRIQQWTLWECDEQTLERMLAEVDQEMGKLESQLRAAEKEFDQLVAAGDPVALDETRQTIHTLGQKWDALRLRGRDIEITLRQKLLDKRMIAIGRRYGIGDLVALLRSMRILILGASLVAVALSLAPGMNAQTIQTLDTINLICSLVLFSEFAMRIALVTGRRAYFFSRLFDIFLSLPLITLAGTVPDLVLIARLLTLLRAGRLVRLILGERRDRVQGIRFLRAPEFRLLQRATITALVLVAIGAAVLHVLEGAGGQPFSSFSENLWWGIKIVLTGEIGADPTSLLGRLVTIGIIVIGISITSILIATITAVLVNLSSETSGIERQQEDINEKLNVVRSQLDLLTNARQEAARAAARINEMLANPPEADEALMNDVVQVLVENFGCLQASIYLNDESTRDAVCIASTGSAAFMPTKRIAFDAGLVGRVATMARRGPDEEPFQSEPLPLADGAAAAFPLCVRRQWRGQRRVMGLGVLHVVIPQAWLRDELIRLLLIDVSVALSQYLYSRESAERHEALLMSISDLQKTMEQVTTTLDYERLLFVIAEGASALLDADMSKVMLLDLASGDGTLRGVAWHGMEDELGRSLHSKLGEGLSGICAKTGNPVKSSNLLTDQRVTVSSSQALRSGMRSELCVPIRARGVLLGVLSVMSKQHKRFSQEEEYLLGTLASQAGAAIENARIYGEAQRELRSANALQAISQKLSETTDERETMNWILGQIGSVVEHDSASILLVEGDALQLAAASGFAPGSLPHDLRFSLAEHRLFARVSETRQPLLILDTAQSADWLDGPVEVRSWIGVPLIVENKIIGLLSIDHHAPNAFTQTDAALAQRFALQAALAVRTARLHSALSACISQQE